jgi:hypothetical protein
MTWRINGHQQRPPLRARLFWYLLTPSELLLLLVMAEHSSDGSCVKASRKRLAAYSGLSPTHIDRLIDGYDDTRTGRHHLGLVERGILSEQSRYSGDRPGSKRRTYIYRINEEAVELDPKMRPYLPNLEQFELPGLSKAAKHKAPTQPISDQPATVHTVITVAPYDDSPHGVERQSTRCGATVHTVLPNTRSVDSRAGDSPLTPTPEKPGGGAQPRGTSISPHRSFAEQFVRDQGMSGKLLTDAIESAAEFCCRRGWQADACLATALVEAFHETRKSARYELTPLKFFQEGLYQSHLPGAASPVDDGGYEASSEICSERNEEFLAWLKKWSVAG